MRCFLSFVALLVGVSLNAAEIRRIPPPGIPVPEADRAELQAGVEALGKEIEALRKEFASSDEWPNVAIFHKAVDWALRYDEFFEPKQIVIAREQLQQGFARAALLRKREAPWNSATGLVVRGYQSVNDGSVQPYGLVIPASWKPDDGKEWRLDFWLHGRGEKLSELAFIDDRQRNRGEFAPDDAIVCHLYGRFCNANKFAGEDDLFQALRDILENYAIHKDRRTVRGFSMGGAACWQFATHHSGLWAAAAPGAGFAETAEFFKVFAPGKTPPPWWEQVLWRWYDSTLYAANLANLKIVAYSGEIDGQKQAADIMTQYAREEGVEFPHIIGPQTAHKYHPDAKAKIEEIVTAAIRSGNPLRDPPNRRVHLTTYTLIYPNADIIHIDGMERQWERADLDVEFTERKGIFVKTKNVTAFHLSHSTVEPADSTVVVDGQRLNIVVGGPIPRFVQQSGAWKVFNAATVPDQGIVKRRHLCGPIDHAFMDSFVFVQPTGPPLNDMVGRWVNSEFAHATEFWRRVFRGDAPVVTDASLINDVIFTDNLILWGDPSSNAMLKKIIDKLPIKWTKDTLVVNGVTYDAAHHVPILIFPNPLSRSHYVVLNSGPTFRERALLNNSDQTPKLPDWAVVDLRTPPDDQWPGLVVDAGFFDEQWALPKN